MKSPKKEKRQILFDKQKGKCFWCGKKLILFKKDDAFKHEKHRQSRIATLDHLVPRSKGGLSTIDNLALCCRVCNISKGSNLINPHTKKSLFFCTTNLSFRIYEQNLKFVSGRLNIVNLKNMPFVKL